MNKYLAAVLAAALLAAAVAPASAAPATATAPFGITVNVPTSASLSLSNNTFTWANVTGFIDTNLPADNNPIGVTGCIRDSKAGSVTLGVSAPADITGAAGNILPISSLTIKCADNGTSGTNAVGVFAPGFVTLTASSTTSCVTWGGKAVIQLRMNLSMFLNDTTLQSDSYTSANGFAVVATAT